MLSFFFSWSSDQSEIKTIFDNSSEIKNIGKKFGLLISYYMIYNGFGLGAILLPALVFLIGISLTFNSGLDKILSRSILLLLSMVWISLFTSYIISNNIYGGIFGHEFKSIIIEFMGDLGFITILVFGFISFLIIKLKITPVFLFDIIKSSIKNYNNSKIVEQNQEDLDEKISQNEDNNDEFNEVQPTIQNFSKIDQIIKKPIDLDSDDKTDGFDADGLIDEITIDIEKIKDEETVDKISVDLLKKFGEFDHTLDLKSFKQPEIKLLNEHDKDGSITINQAELEENKEKIIDTLRNYKIGIEKIKATIGPTVTLYEIIPEAGVRISKIKSLEDDIALSLSALGIRIIAPIPGKGTIGIEVPNKNRKIVSMKSLISSKKYQEAEMELPLALGKTISNETLVVDLTKMPHLLVAGATGQGKSVGINAIITSTLYKKHPAEVKFILVDPKKVELTLFNKIERHYLAKLPDSEESIITDTNKVVKTLKSLCIEMEKRYELLKDAMCRNIKEYNSKFKKRKLNPNDGHKFLPYLVLVVDEFADIIMTAGKEVENPIGRLAQLARAVGIHLIIATQRPSVNVITGLIKANFPARIAFKVTAKVDSRTILDSGGADQLIGNGDMLFTQGNDLVRLQCGFIDTDEIEKITDIIGSQRGYSEAYLLPECEEDSISSLEDNIEDRDPLFKDAAEIVVLAQQGSASLLQRKMKLGYNRAGRIIDQLEAAGIVGPFEGSKARDVLVKDLVDLKELLKN
tara:strand:+ start:432 stop:2669 length:2238 start_codon:yes stop_codon:yes gene_type:complete